MNSSQFSDFFKSNLATINAAIKRACEKYDRPNVSLIGVSKFHPQSEIRTALECGMRLFGENHVREACDKFPDLKRDYPDLKLHIIGGLQTNKLNQACEIADTIQTLDRPSLLSALEKRDAKNGRIPDLFVQINVGDEPQKSGVSTHDAPYFIERALKSFPAKIKGLMAIPPAHENPESYFLKLKTLAEEFDLRELSMGMSSDFETAIACGATVIRVGTALFGERL